MEANDEMMKCFRATTEFENDQNRTPFQEKKHCTVSRRKNTIANHQTFTPPPPRKDADVLRVPVLSHLRSWRGNWSPFFGCTLKWSSGCFGGTRYTFYSIWQKGESANFPLLSNLVLWIAMFKAENSTKIYPSPPYLKSPIFVASPKQNQPEILQNLTHLGPSRPGTV